MDVRLPDGTIIQNVPDGTTKADLVAKLKSNGHTVPSEWLADAAPEKPAAVRAGEAISDIPRQIGLTARGGINGLAGIAEIATEPLRKAVVNPIARQFGLPEANQSLRQVTNGLMTQAGLPEPQGANERVVQQAVETMAGAGGTVGAARSLAAKAGPVMSGVLNGLSANPTQQLVSGAAAGGAGGAVKEAGGGPLEQAGAAMAGGVGAGLLAGPVAGFASAVKRMLTPSASLQEVDQAITLVMQRSGVDWSQVPERIRQGMRAEVGQAMKTGQELDPLAVRKLLDFKTTGTTPTRGMLTGDPVQVTREQNLSRVGANSSDIGLQKLPRVHGDNSAKLLDNLDGLGASQGGDAYATGQKLISPLQRNIDNAKSHIDALYASARDSRGRSVPLNGHEFTQRANKLLDDGLLGHALPPSVAEHMNRIAKGEVPFTVDYAEQLKTAMAKLQRSTSDGQQRMALGVVRQALEETGISPSVQAGVPANPGQLPAINGTIPPGQSVGQEAINAFNKARAANRYFMGEVERIPALKAVYDGAEPDQFVKKFITGSSATVKDVNALAGAVKHSPEASQAVKSYIAGHLKNVATGGATDINKFNAASFNRELSNIGDRKLAAFFSPEEVAQIKSIGRVATYMKAQPDGSAVNNSNSGALIFGRGLDMLDRIAGKLPLGANTMIQGSVRGLQQSRAMAVPPSLLATQPDLGLLQRIPPSALYGGLLAAQPVNDQ